MFINLMVEILGVKMKATINGIEVSGTPEEIAELIKIERPVDLITGICMTDFYIAPLIPSKFEGDPDDFIITKDRYKDGALRITIRVASYLEKLLIKEYTKEKKDNLSLSDEFILKHCI